MNKQQIAYYLLVAAGIGGIFPIPVHSVCIGLFVLAAIWSKPSLKNLKAWHRPVFLSALLLFVWLIAAIAISDNQSEAWRYTERKLSLLLLPIGFLFFRFRNDAQYFNLLRLYCITIAAAAAWCLLRALLHNLQFPDETQVWFYHQLSAYVHLNAIYFSAWCLLALVLLLEYRKQLFPKPVVFAALYLLINITIILLSSKTVVALWLLHLVYVLASRLRIKASHKAAAILLLTGTLLVGLWQIPFLRNRIETELHGKLSVLSQAPYQYNTHFSGTSIRLVFWQQSLRILQEKKAWAAGVGTGDFQNLLNQKYIEIGLYTGNPTLHDHGYLGYNPHNQYVEVLLSTGFIGLFFFTFWIYTLFRIAWLRNHTPFLMLLVMFSVMCITECLFSSNKGITWFLFFGYLFVSWQPENTRPKKTD